MAARASKPHSGRSAPATFPAPVADTLSVPAAPSVSPLPATASIAPRVARLKQGKPAKLASLPGLLGPWRSGAARAEPSGCDTHSHSTHLRPQSSPDPPRSPPPAPSAGVPNPRKRRSRQCAFERGGSRVSRQGRAQGQGLSQRPSSDPTLPVPPGQHGGPSNGLPVGARGHGKQGGTVPRESRRRRNGGAARCRSSPP